MIAEISAIVAGVNAATSAIKRVAETTNDISSISSFLSTLGGAEVELARAQNSGGLSEADAVKAALAKISLQSVAMLNYTMKLCLLWLKQGRLNKLNLPVRQQPRRNFGRTLEK